MSGIVASNILDSTGIVKAPASGGWAFISKQTASSSATIDFTSGIDSTYKEYVFYFKNIHPQTDDKHFTFQANASGASGFNETINSTHFRAYQLDNGSATGGLGYRTANDQANGTGYQRISEEQGNENTESLNGILHLFNPSNTTFVKHFISRVSSMMLDSGPRDVNVGGYINTTSAIDEISFKFTSGNIDSGDICLFGLKTWRV